MVLPPRAQNRDVVSRFAFLAKARCESRRRVDRGVLRIRRYVPSRFAAAATSQRGRSTRDASKITEASHPATPAAVSFSVRV